MTNTSARTVGTLYVVATPIGNRDDISLRAISTLQMVDKIIAEDTRHSTQLLTFLGIKKPIISLHAHNEEQRSESIIEALQKGQTFALISDAGTPLISDPGFPLVKQARALDLPVIPIPGACAFIAALSAAGIPCDTFTFAGFLPAKQTARRNKLAAMQSLEHTLVFYESTHRIIESIEDIAFVFGSDCEIVLAKELTKTFENFLHKKCQEIVLWLQEEGQRCKGEFVVIIPPRKSTQETYSNEHILSILLAELPLKQAVKLTAQITQEHKNELYKTALEMQKIADSNLRLTVAFCLKLIHNAPRSWKQRRIQ